MYYDTTIGHEDGCRGNMVGRPPDLRAHIEHLNCALAHICEVPRTLAPHDVPQFVVLLSSDETPQGRVASKGNIMSQNLIFEPREVPSTKLMAEEPHEAPQIL